MRALIIAEAGVNHNGDRDVAMALVDAAAKAGADMVKFQTFQPCEVISRRAPKAEYQLTTTDTGESQLDMAKALQLKDQDFFDLAARCKEKGIEFFSTPFDLYSVDFLIQKMKLSFIKIPSGEITNAPLLLRAARRGVRIILSTGMCHLSDVQEALAVLAFGYTEAEATPSAQSFSAAYAGEPGKQALQHNVGLMHCTTEYPAPISETNLMAMQTLRDEFGLPVGYSDHTPGITTAIVAATLGAAYVEKHFTLDCSLPGPDHKASLEPDGLAAMVKGIREAESSLGDGIKQPTRSETKNIAIARKSLVARHAIAVGEIFTEENLASKRPGTGISPMRYWEWIGQSATRAYEVDELIDDKN